MDSLWKSTLYKILIIFCTITLCTSLSDTKHLIKNKRNSTQQQHDNFLIIDHLNDNEKETRIKWKDLMGKQTTLDMEENERFVNSSLKLTSLWQLTNGKSFAQLIFNGNNLLDCEYIEDGNEIAIDFVDKFIDEYHYIRREKLSSTKHAKHHQYHESENIDSEMVKIKPNVRFLQLKKFQDIPENIMGLMNLKKLKNQCNRLHEEIKQKLQHVYSNGEENEEDLNAEEESTIRRTKRQTDSWFIAPHTKWCGRGNSALYYKELGPSKADQCCRKHDICKVHIPGLEKRYGLFNIRPFTLSHCRCDRSDEVRSRRMKRDLSNLLIIPYTKYCGIGWTAKKYSEIGAFSKTDKCCRTHDYCPHYIGSFDQKWGLFNWSLNTIMRCKCDDRFRTCLKMADSSDANMVGKLFFNIIQTKCFVLKSENTCILYSWWGKCLKYKAKKRAYIRDNQKY